MDSTRSFWPSWLESLRQSGLQHWVAWALDSAGPLNILGAQFIYLASPIFLNGKGQAQALASILEDESETRAFVTYLRDQS